MKKLAAGNWKMNGTMASLAEVTALVAAHPDRPATSLLCPPATLISRMAGAAGLPLKVGGQDCHAEPRVRIPATLGGDAGAMRVRTYVIVGHSERRADHGETDARSAPRPRRRGAGLTPSSASARREAERETGRRSP